MGNIESQEDENETINLEDVQTQIHNLSPEQIKILKQKLNISNSTTFGAIGEVSLTPTNVDGQDQSVVETSILNGQPVVTDN